MSTFVLIHGAGGDHAYWYLVEPELRRHGHDVVAPDLPSGDDAAGWEEYAAAVVEAVGDRTDLVVVAQSLGGFTAALVCERLEVDLLVYLAAMVPLPGETGGEWWTATGYDALGLDLAMDSEEDITRLFLHDLEPDVLREALRHGGEQSGTPMGQPLPIAAAPAVPTRVLIGAQDRFFPAEWMRGVVRDRLGIEPDEIDSGHCPALSRPAELAARLDAYAKEIAMPAPYTHRRLTDVRDSAPDFGLGDAQEVRFANDDLGTQRTGLTHHRLAPGQRPNFAHRHVEAEEVYVVLSGSGRLKLDDEILEVAERDAIRVAPSVTRGWEAGPDGLEILAVGARHPADGEAFTDWWVE